MKEWTNDVYSSMQSLYIEVVTSLNGVWRDEVLGVA